MKSMLVIVSVLAVTSTIFAQGMGQRRQFYDTNSVITYTGTIASVDSQASPRGNNYMIRLTVKDTSGTTNVVVGPTSYLDSQSITFNKGDTVKVTGSKMTFNGNDVVISAQIVSHGKTIKLRDDTGRPVWMREMR